MVLSLEFWGPTKEPKSTQSVQNRQSGRKVVLALEKRTPKKVDFDTPKCDLHGRADVSRPVATYRTPRELSQAKSKSRLDMHSFD